ncbi:hypothetical protein [Myceligenerans salitolerans]|uniref:Uncharacterized protein n=1 Tax=Myceligenerans salitolerans TaxID=1230528 RepID=A0ABS3I3U1_9MICO|nr:hypothetical protein [Myceligenerans salitolerans]MBO0607644.1 hypothetical protein [Myceligenerans salitolerans]
MVDIADDLLPGPVFAVARSRLARARASRSRINALWNSMRTDQPFSAWVESPEPLVHEVWCSFEPGDALQREADEAMAAFLRDIKAALDACVLAAANAVCRPIGWVEPEVHQMPLVAEPSEFDSLPARGQLRGLRPDQVRALRLLQPFTERLDATSARTIARDMAHLAAGLEALSEWEASQGERLLFTAWASKADPKPALPDGVRIEEREVDPAGPLHQPKRLARFTLHKDSAGASFAGNPNVSFDVILNTGPRPDDPDDNFAHRSHGLVAITRHLIEGLERSVSDPYRVDLLRALDLPEQKVDTWLPVEFNSANEEADVRGAIVESDRGMATYLNGDGTLVYMRLSGDGRVLGREIAPARDLLDASLDGTAVEEATRAAAGRWGLPDLVLRPKVYAKGRGVRELGDGTILAGLRGISLQVKARGVTGDTPERARKWMLKNAAQGLRQARGTIRTALLNPAVELTNLRGRTVKVHGSAVAWIPVVVIDHPDSPPTGVIPAPDPRGPSVVLTRRDWEFLWDQLRSATAVVDYIHRVAQEEEPLELGAESNRYLDLAEKDAHAPPRRLPDWIPETGAVHTSLPLLPYDPAGSADRFGQAIFQRILEDIADTDFAGDETDRIALLSYIDRVAVGARAELGRLLLRRLIQCAEAAPDGHRMDHRVMYIDEGSLQVTFTTMSQLTDYHQEIYRSWLLLRRQDFLKKSGALGPIYPWTVGVLLTPRPDGPRPWDTTTISTNGPPPYDATEYARLTKVFEPNLCPGCASSARVRARQHTGASEPSVRTIAVAMPWQASSPPPTQVVLASLYNCGRSPEG